MASEVDLLLKNAGAVLIRKRKHEVWRLPDGRNFVRAQTPSDKKADVNSLTDLKKILGIKNENGGGIRREKKQKNRREEIPHYQKNINPLADKLRLTGITESALRERIEFLEKQNDLLTEELSESCWFCSLRNYVKMIFIAIKAF